MKRSYDVFVGLVFLMPQWACSSLQKVFNRLLKKKLFSSTDLNRTRTAWNYALWLRKAWRHAQHALRCVTTVNVSWHGLASSYLLRLLAVITYSGCLYLHFGNLQSSLQSMRRKGSAQHEKLSFSWYFRTVIDGSIIMKHTIRLVFIRYIFTAANLTRVLVRYWIDCFTSDTT